MQFENPSNYRLKYHRHTKDEKSVIFHIETRKDGQEWEKTDRTFIMSAGFYMFLAKRNRICIKEIIEEYRRWQEFA